MDLFDYFVIAYLGSHIPITMCVDAQAVLPHSFYPQAFRDMLHWYKSWSNDILMDPSTTAPDWFRAIVSAEILLQLPFFFFAVYAWVYRVETVKGLNIRFATIVYGAHTATTLLPILGTFFLSPEVEGYRVLLTLIYCPYLIMPLLMMWRALERDVLFPPVGKGSLNSGRSLRNKKQ